MASFLKSLFGGGKQAGEETAQAEAVAYKGCMIVPAPRKEGAQWRLAGIIRKEVDGATRERAFVRADLFSDRETAVQFSIQKAQLVIDQRADLFSGAGDDSPV